MNVEATQSVFQRLPVIPNWAKAGDDCSAVILTTRVRFARNLAGERFTNRLDKEGKERVLRIASHALQKFEMVGEGFLVSLGALTSAEIALLIERRSISPRFAQRKNPRAVFLWKDCDRAAMIGEEDHLHVAEILPGLAPVAALEGLTQILNQLAAELPYAEDPALGYLTASPMNLGAAMRTSLFCHLPGLVANNGMDQLASYVADAGFTVRGFWGEGSEIIGNIFQLTDGPALSFDPPTLASRIQSLGQEVMEREALARIELQTSRALMLKDKIARALAILQNCRALSAPETLALFSAIRLGIDIGFVDGLDRKTISLLIFELGGAYLEWTGISESQGINPLEFRASRVRKEFALAKFIG
jgi:protein arginine kinase